MDGMRFLNPSNNYEKLTMQVDFLGNHTLASDMRSITLGTNIFILAIVGFISFMLIIIVVPFVLWCLWAMRELRNKKKRTQMMNSATMFVLSNPVPANKIHLIGQLGING